MNPDKSKLFAFSRDTEISYVNGRTQNPEYRRILYAIVDQWQTVIGTGTCTAANIEPMIQALKHRSPILWETGGQRLFQLSWHYPIARQAISELMTSGNAQTRFNIVAESDRAEPLIAIEVLRLGLHDSSAKVRGKAVERAWSTGVQELTRGFQSMLLTESHAAVQKSLRFALENPRGFPSQS